VTAVLLGRPGAAQAETVYADFDRDGHGDVLTVVPGSPTTLQVWLSSTQTLRQLRVSRPILRVAAFDVDGDGHPEIVASDMSAGLHIWRRTKNGHLHRVRPHRTLPQSLGLSGRGVTRPVTEAADDPMAGSDWVPAAETPTRSTLHPPDASGRLASAVPPAVADPGLAPSSSRAPPISH
jgi:hypothetical protein